MSVGYNRIILAGNITRDPENRVIGSGDSVTKFTLAVNRKAKNKDEATFIDVVAWGKLSDICGQYLKKGSSVLVEGRLSIRSYEDKDGAKRKATEVVMDSIQFLDKKQEKRDDVFDHDEEIEF